LVANLSSDNGHANFIFDNPVKHPKVSHAKFKGSVGRWSAQREAVFAGDGGVILTQGCPDSIRYARALRGTKLAQLPDGFRRKPYFALGHRINVA